MSELKRKNKQKEKDEKSKLRAKQKEQKKLKKQNRKKGANRQILQITYIFVGLFLALIGYITYFVVVESESVITDPHNLRLQEMAKNVVRGKIISSDGKVLAQTVTDGDGKEERDYPYSRMFAHVVGYNDKGKSGIESKANFALLTSHANIFSQVKSNLSGEKLVGDDVYTTLDYDVQEAAYESLNGKQGAVVAMDPETGKVLAMVSKPDYRPALVADNWEELNSSDPSLLLNRATQGLYPPGSTFKVVTALEYMREHKDYEDFTYTCKGSTTVDGLTIKCYGGAVHGTVNLEEAVEKSCNTAFVHLSQDLSKNKLAALSEDLLFGSRVPINLLASASRFSLSNSSGNRELAHTAIGQGQTLITPLQNAVLMSTIANDGTMMQPYLVDEVKNADGGVVSTTDTKELGQPLEKAECETLKTMLKKVVESGTGTNAYSSNYEVYGKTGSAEYNAQKDSHAWFIGCAQQNGKKIVVSVLVEGGDSGGRTAAPIAKDVFDAYFQ